MQKINLPQLESKVTDTASARKELSDLLDRLERGEVDCINITHSGDYKASIRIAAFPSDVHEQKKQLANLEKDQEITVWLKSGGAIHLKAKRRRNGTVYFAQRHIMPIRYWSIPQLLDRMERIEVKEPAE